MRTQFAIRRREIESHLEHWITAQTGGVIAVFVACRDHHKPEADDISKAVPDLIGCARVVDASRHAIGDVKPLLNLP